VEKIQGPVHSTWIPTLLKNPFDECLVLHRAAEFKVEFTQSEHFRPKHRILESLRDTEIAKEPSDFELSDQFQLICSPVTPDRVKERFVKSDNPLEIFVDQVSLDGNLLEGVKDPGDVDRLGTAGRAGLARNALPNGGGPGRHIDIAVLHQADQRTGYDIHLIAHRATSGALSALITIGDFRMGEFFDPGNFWRNVCVHNKVKGEKVRKGIIISLISFFGPA